MNFNKDDEYFSQKDIAKLMLEKIIEAFSLEEVMVNIITLATTREEEIILKDKIPLDSIDFLAFLYKTLGSVELMKCLLELYNKIKKKRKKRKKFTKKKKKEKFFKAPKLAKKEKEENKENGVVEYTYHPQRNNPINIDSNNMMDDFIIEIKDMNENQSDNEYIISLEEGDSSDNDQNDINCGAKSEIKSPKPKINLDKKIGNGNAKEKKGINSESKIFTTVKKSPKKKLYDMYYHYLMNYGDLYKYKFDEMNEKENIAKFSCDDQKCISIAEYNLTSKVFDFKMWHSIPHNEHSYIKDFNAVDSLIKNYMTKHNIYDLGLSTVQSKRIENHLAKK